MGRRVKTIADWINTNTDYIAKVRETIENTDRTHKGYRYITSPGKGRKGFILTVTTQAGKRIYEHNSAETYRNNQEIEEWIKARMPSQPPEDWRDPHYA